MEPGRRQEKRRRDAYLCLWVNRPARDQLDKLAADRGISRSEMARAVFTAGLLTLGVDSAALRTDPK